VGIPDEKWGEGIVAVVVARPGVELNIAELQAHVEPQLASYKHPQQWEVFSSLPRNAGGKVVKRDVVSQLADLV
jgi:fatty-acyl-CoA synthase